MFKRAYHGTPHRGIERFSLEKIGTGEGAQAYGWGLYFAQAKGTAESYKDKLSKAGKHHDLNERIDAIEIGGQKLLDRFAVERDEKLYELASNNNHTAAPFYALERAEKWEDLAKDKDYPHQDYAQDRALAWRGLLEALEKGETLSTSDRGQLYEVSLPEDHELLDWDKPLSEQPEGVKKKLENFVKEYSAKEFTDGPEDALVLLARDINDKWSPEGTRFYQRLSEAFSSSKAASQYLNSLGIPGLRYLDGMSRGKGEGTHNYVIWDENTIDIVRTYYRRNGRKDPFEGAASVKAKDVQAALEPLQRSAANALPTTVVQSQQDLPKHVLDANESKGGGIIEGVYDPQTGHIYVVADNLTSADQAAGAWMAQAVQAWKHEQGHHGLRGFFEATFGREWERQFKNFLGWVSFTFQDTQAYKDTANLYKGERADVIAEEFFVRHVVEKVAMGRKLNENEQTVWQKFVSFVKRLLGHLQPGVNHSQADLERVAMGVMGWLENGSAGFAAMGDGARFSKAQAARSVAEMRHENFEKLSQSEQKKVLAEAQRQLDNVKEVRDDQGRLLAPNGKPSKLNERQWKQVRTPWFKEWFGDWELEAQMADASEFVDRALSGNVKGRLTLEMWNPDPKGDISRALGGRVVKHEMNANDIRHIMNAHGDPAQEASRGQVAVTPDDIKLIPWILRNYDRVKPGSMTPRGQKSVRYEKRINGVVVYVEAEAGSKGEMSSKTMWIRPSVGANALPKGVPDNTSGNAHSRGHAEKVREILDSVKSSCQ